MAYYHGIITPRGLAGIIARFGNPLSRGYEAKNIALFPLPFPLMFGNVVLQRARCHRLLVPVFTSVLETIKARGLTPHVRHFGGTYVLRPIIGDAVRLSTHAWGIAIDLNPATNQLGTAGDMHPGVIDVFEQHRFIWGGNFRRRDPMHFQFASGY